MQRAADGGCQLEHDLRMRSPLVKTVRSARMMRPEPAVAHMMRAEDISTDTLTDRPQQHCSSPVETAPARRQATDELNLEPIGARRASYGSPMRILLRGQGWNLGSGEDR